MSPLPVRLWLSPNRTQWMIYIIGQPWLGSGRGRMIESHKVGCHCEAPGVGT